LLFFQQVENIWMCVCTIPGLELRRALTCHRQVVFREPTSSPGIVDYGFPDKVEATLREKVTLTL
ncbi:MAG: hypothetical protein IIU89_03565, partial [Bacteroidales bacterium]|nr:hypothetical protein [Bacteroidales bacterium]